MALLLHLSCICAGDSGTCPDFLLLSTVKTEASLKLIKEKWMCLFTAEDHFTLVTCSLKHVFDSEVIPWQHLNNLLYSLPRYLTYYNDHIRVSWSSCFPPLIRSESFIIQHWLSPNSVLTCTAWVNSLCSIGCLFYRLHIKLVFWMHLCYSCHDGCSLHTSQVAVGLLSSWPVCVTKLCQFFCFPDYVCPLNILVCFKSKVFPSFVWV